MRPGQPGQAGVGIRCVGCRGGGEWFWSWLWAVLLALTYGALVLGLVVTIVLPVLLALVWDAMVVRVTRDRGLPTPGEHVGGCVPAVAVFMDDADAPGLVGSGVVDFVFSASGVFKYLVWSRTGDGH